MSITQVQYTPRKFIFSTVIEVVVVVVSSKSGILEPFWPQIFFSSQSTILREDIYQKSAIWLHLDSRETTLKILKNPLTFYTRIVVSPLLWLLSNKMGKLKQTKDLLYRGCVIQNKSAVPYQGKGWGDSNEVGTSLYQKNWKVRKIPTVANMAI